MRPGGSEGTVTANVSTTEAFEATEHADDENRRSLPTWWLGIAALVGAILLWRYLADFARADRWRMIDLDIYRWGGEKARTSDDLYQATYYKYLGFTYTPFAAVVFVPMSLLASSALKISMTVASIAALAVTVGAAFHSLGYRRDRGWVGATLAVTAVCASLEPVHETLLLGQVNLILMALIVVDLLLPDTSRFKGIGVGIAAGFKLTPLIFIPYLLLTRRWMPAARAVMAAAATVVVGFVVLPHESADFWFGRLFMNSERVGPLEFVANQGVHGTLVRALGSTSEAGPYWWAAAIVIGIGGLLVAAQVSRRGPELAGILTCALTGLLISPVTWSHHWVWIAPALVLCVHLGLRHDVWGQNVWGQNVWGWLGAAAIVVLFTSLTPKSGIIWAAPNYKSRELAWTTSQSVFGNLYVIIGLLTLVGLAWWSRPRTRSMPPAT